MNVEQFVPQIPLLTDDDRRMIARDDFSDQVTRARDYLANFHLSPSKEGRWRSAYGQKHSAEAWHRKTSIDSHDYVSDTAFCIAYLSMGGQLKIEGHRRMVRVGRKKVDFNAQMDEGCSPRYRSKFWEWVISLPTTDNPRSDFIHDSKDVYESYSWNPEPNKELWEVYSEKLERGCDAADQECTKLEKIFANSV